MLLVVMLAATLLGTLEAALAQGKRVVLAVGIGGYQYQSRLSATPRRRCPIRRRSPRPCRCLRLRLRRRPRWARVSTW